MSLVLTQMFRIVKNKKLVEFYIANPVRNPDVCLDRTPSFQLQIAPVCRICYLELLRISAVRQYLSEDLTKELLCAFVFPSLS